MKAPHLLLALSLTLAAPVAHASAPAPAAAPAAAVPATPEAWVRHLADFTRNADMLVDPKKFIAALHQVTEPAFLLAAFSAALDPTLYQQSMASALDPRAQANYARLFDPNVATRWMTTLMDPQFINAVTYTLLEPGKLSRWMMLPMDPRVAATLLAALNPNPQAQPGMMGADPRLWAPQMLPPTPQPMPPAMMPGWQGAWMAPTPAPQAAPPGWGGWMLTPQGAVPMFVPAPR